MTQKTLKIHSENILPIIKKWLYSERDIFVRELVSNATDALSKLKLLNKQESLHLEESSLRIDLTLDKERKAILFSDTGIGMTQEEVEKYIAQIAFSGAQEFAEKYQRKEEMIGHFGLGFYSSYMVSSHVEIETLSYQKDAHPVFWSCDGSSSYLIEKGSKKERGTQIALFLQKEAEDLLDEGKLSSLLQTYCSFLPFPIYLNGKKINHEPPLWLKNSSECSKKEYLDFYHKLYPLEPDPIFWIHLQTDYPFHLKGILYFPKMTKQLEFSKGKVQLYCNRVFVSQSLKDLLPDFLTVLQGALDSPDIPLNVSRSYLQADQKVKQLSSHIGKKVADRLKHLYQSEPKTFEQFWPDIEPVIKYGALQDDKFYEKIKEVFLWKDLMGKYSTLEEYKALYQEKSQGKIYYTQDAKLPPSLAKVFEEKGLPVFVVNPFFDIPLINLIEEKEKVAFQRVDSSLEDIFLDPSKEKSLLEADGRSQASHLADFVKSTLGISDLQVEAKSLASTTLPALFSFDEKERRMNDYFKMSQGQDFALPLKKTFVINTNHKLVQQAAQMRLTTPSLSKKIFQQIYQLCSLSQKELATEQIAGLVQNNLELLEELLVKKS